MPLVPRLTIEWAAREPETSWRQVAGSVAFADISGFSRLSEQLAEMGPAGTEELTDIINGCFESVIAAATARGGDVLKIVGDGVLVLFDGPDHAARAAAASIDMHAALTQPQVASTGRPVRLRMSIGAHTGEFTFLMTSGRHRELVVCGDAASEVLRCEKTAVPGQTVVSADMAAALPGRSLGARRAVGVGEGRVLRRVDEPAATRGRIRGRVPDLTAYVPVAQRELLAIGATGEHRQCAISFVSIGGTDDVLRTDGPAALAAVISRVTDAVDEATERWCTQFLSSDHAPNAVGLMLTGGVPTSSGHDDERLLRTVRQVVDVCGDLDLRAGVNRGRIYAGFVGSSTRRGFTAVGDAVNLSARLVQGAGPGEIVASRAVLDWSDTRFEEQPLAPFKVRNRVSLVEASVVGAVAERKPRGALHDLPFVGREDQLASLERAADAAIAGHGAVLVLLGDAGIGKSRLLVELQRRRPDLEPLDLAADEYSSTVPYALVRTMIGRLAEFEPEVEPTTMGDALRRWIAAVAPDELPWLPLLATVFGVPAAPTSDVDDLAEEFRSARLRRSAATVIDRVLDRPALVVLDDAQWIDDASADLLATVVADVAERPRLVCLLVSGHDAPAWAADATVIELEPLTSAETRRLAASAATGRVDTRHLDLLAGRSGGNPLFLANLVDTVEATGEVDSLPSTIESLVTRRIDDLGGRDRMLLREAAVSGMEVDLPLLGRVLGTRLVNRADAWRRLSPFLGRVGPGRLRFQHGMYQRVAYEGLSFRRRREIHLAIGDDLERHGAEPAVLSLHFWRGQDHSRAYRWSAAAATAAQRAYANAEAAELYRRALASAAHVSTVGREDRTVLAEALGDVLELSADYDGAADAYGDARRTARDPNGTTSVRTAARLHRKVGVLREHAGAYSDALRWYSRAIRLLGGGGTAAIDGTDLAELAELELAYGGVRYRQGNAHDARSWCLRAIEHATAAGDDAALGHAYYLLTVVDLALGSAAPASSDVAVELLERTGDLVQQANLYNNLGFAAYFTGDWDAALGHYERSRDLGRRSGDVVLDATAANNIGEILSDRGQVGAAVELFMAAHEAFASARYTIGEAIVVGNLGRARLRLGDLDDAQRLLEAARQQFDSINASSYVAEALVRLAECAIASGRPQEALTLAEQAELRLRLAPDPFVGVGARRVRAEAELAAGLLAAAVVTADDAVARAGEAGARFEEARALAVRSAVRRALAGAADRDAAEAAAILARLGVAPGGRAAPAE